MSTTNYEKKLTVLRVFLEWLPSQKESFQWNDPCRCWLPMIPRFLGVGAGSFGANILSCEGDTTKTRYKTQLYRQEEHNKEALSAVLAAGFTYKELGYFEYCFQWWLDENKHYTKPLWEGGGRYNNFDAGLAFVDSWIEHLKNNDK